MNPEFPDTGTTRSPFCIDQMPEAPQRGSHHRLAHSDTFFRFPDDLLFDVGLSSLDLPVTTDAFSINSRDAATSANQLDTPMTFDSCKSEDFSSNSKNAGGRPPISHFWSLSDFFQGVSCGKAACDNGDNGGKSAALDVPSPSGGRRPGFHGRNNSIDGTSSSFEADSILDGVKKVMTPDQLADLALIDPGRAKKILANRQSTGELERKVETLQTEATTLSTQVRMLQVKTSFGTAMKKTLGRRRIPIRKIENKPNRRTSFSKRRAGLFKKASELSTLCGSEIAVIVFSEAGNAFAYGHPSPDSVIQRYVNCPDSPPQKPIHAESAGNGIRKFCSNEEAIQWENRISRLGLDELKLYASDLQKIRDIVTAKAASMASPSGYVADKKNDALSDNGNRNSSSHDLDNCFDDVNWGDIESYMANTPMTSPDCGKAQVWYDEYIQFGEAAFDVMPTSSSSVFEVDTQPSYESTQVGDGALDGSYLHSVVMPTSSSSALDGGYLHSDVIPTSSSSSLEVDTQFYSCLSDIQWQEEEDAWF